MPDDIGPPPQAAAEIAGWITPVPGGTGPMTNVMLLKNLLAAAKRQMNP